MLTETRMVRMGTLPIRIRRMMYCKPLIHQCRMWRTEGIVLDSVQGRHNISDW